MLGDRSYMRTEYRPNSIWASPTVILILVNVAVFFSGWLAPAFQEFEVRYFALSLEGIRDYHYLWQVLTFQFLHGGLLHILVNCATFYMFGRQMEQELGTSKFLTLYFLSGAVGGLLQIGGQAFFPSLMDSAPGAAVIGASAGVFGVIAAFAVLFPERPLTMLILLFIPVNMRAKFLLPFAILFEIFWWYFGDKLLGEDVQVAHLAHIGGILFGAAFTYFGVRRGWIARISARFSRAPQRKIPVSFGRGAPESENLPPGEFMSQEVDPILDKISAQGIHSLTERERRILEAARNRMAKR